MTIRLTFCGRDAINCMCKRVELLSCKCCVLCVDVVMQLSSADMEVAITAQKQAKLDDAQHIRQSRDVDSRGKVGVSRGTFSG